jgi:hypothetical protein
MYDSDASIRLTMVLTAAETLEDLEYGPGVHGNDIRACIRAAEALLESPCPRWRERFLIGKRGRGRFSKEIVGELNAKPSPVSASGQGKQLEQRDARFGELDAMLAAEESRKDSRAEADIPLLSLAKTIGSQVNRYRKQNPTWRKQFDHQIALFRSDYCRDADWYREAEQGYENWLREFRKREQTFDWFRAMPIAVLAAIYQEQGKYRQALSTLREAIQAAHKAIMHDDYRRHVIRWLRVNMKACAHRIGPIGTPAYLGPRLPSEVTCA